MHSFEFIYCMKLVECVYSLVLLVGTGILYTFPSKQIAPTVTLYSLTYLYVLIMCPVSTVRVSSRITCVDTIISSVFFKSNNTMSSKFSVCSTHFNVIFFFLFKIKTIHSFFMYLKLWFFSSSISAAIEHIVGH